MQRHPRCVANVTPRIGATNLSRLGLPHLSFYIAAYNGLFFFNRKYCFQNNSKFQKTPIIKPVRKPTRTQHYAKNQLPLKSNWVLGIGHCFAWWASSSPGVHSTRYSVCVLANRTYKVSFQRLGKRLYRSRPTISDSSTGKKKKSNPMTQVSEIILPAKKLQERWKEKHFSLIAQPRLKRKKVFLDSYSPSKFEDRAGLSFLI